MLNQNQELLLFIHTFNVSGELYYNPVCKLNQEGCNPQGEPPKYTPISLEVYTSGKHSFKIIVKDSSIQDVETTSSTTFN